MLAYKYPRIDRHSPWSRGSGKITPGNPAREYDFIFRI